MSVGQRARRGTGCAEVHIDSCLDSVAEALAKHPDQQFAYYIVSSRKERLLMVIESC